MFTVAPRATSRPVAWLVCGRPFTPPFICPTSFYFTKRDNQHSGWNSNFRICRVDFWIGYFELFQRNFGLKFECQFNDSYHKKINIKSVTRTSSRHAKRSASTMRQRLKVDAATEEDEPGWSSGLQVSENEPGWVQVESPKNSFGSGLQVSENLQSYMQTGNQMTTEEYKRGRKLLSEKKGTYLFCSILLYDTRTHSQSFFCSICFLFFCFTPFLFSIFSCSPIISY